VGATPRTKGGLQVRIPRCLVLAGAFAAALPLSVDAEQVSPARRGQVTSARRDTPAAKAKDLRTPESAMAPKAADVRTNPKDGPAYVWIPPGTFQMGCAPADEECDPDEKPQHPVTIGRGFWMGRTEVTVAAYGKSAAVVPEGQEGADHPVINITRDEARAFCQWSGGRLPTEAEWEYAARGGRDGLKYPWGNTISHEDANYIGTDGRDDWDVTSPVGSFPANGFGLFDITGNVWEWVQDDYHDSYQGAPGDGSAWQDSGRAFLRGGSWFCLPKYVRTSNRNLVPPGARRALDGFRCVRDVAP